MQQEFYPMPSFPKLAVKDLVASTHWYQDVLGFTNVFEMPGHDGRPVLTHLRWTKYADLLLVPDKTDTSSVQKGVGVSITFALFENDIDEFAEKVKMKGATMISAPVTQPWNAREFMIRDLDGYCLVFTQQANKQMNIDQVVEQVRQSIH